MTDKFTNGFSKTYIPKVPEACKTEQQLINLFNIMPEWVGWVVKQTATNSKNPNIKLYRKVLKRMFDDLKLEEA